MKHEDLIELGFKMLGEDENDTFYRLTFKPPFAFGIDHISGNFNENQVFYLYGNDKEYKTKAELSFLIECLRPKGSNQTTIEHG